MLPVIPDAYALLLYSWITLINYRRIYDSEIGNFPHSACIGDTCFVKLSNSIHGVVRHGYETPDINRTDRIFYT